MDPRFCVCPGPAELKTIAFLDCCGYTAYTETHGDVAGVEVHLHMRQAVESSAAEAGVVIVKWTGDGAMVAADTSTTALACIYRAMLAMRQSAPLALRAGAAFGLVRRVPCGELDYLGAAVNRAARLCDQAAPWQACVDHGRERVGMRFTLRPT